MKISVIIPVKNRAHLIGETLHSVLAQTYSPFEVIVVDDGSTDNLKEVVESFGPKVKLVPNEGRGPGAGRNTGLRMAQGDLIQFFDSDDIMSPNKFSVQVKVMERENADLVYGPYVNAVSENGTWRRIDSVMQYLPIPPMPLENAVVRGWVFLAQTVLIKTSLLKEAGFWREDIWSYEDWEYGYRIARKVKKFVHENESFVIYRNHGQQLTQSHTTELQRIMDQRQVCSYIRQNPPRRFSLSERLLFAGVFASTEYALKRLNSTDRVSPFYAFADVYNRLDTKRQLLRNKSGWKDIYGAVDSENLFQNYLKLFK